MSISRRVLHVVRKSKRERCNSRPHCQILRPASDYRLDRQKLANSPNSDTPDTVVRPSCWQLDLLSHAMMRLPSRIRGLNRMRVGSVRLWAHRWCTVVRLSWYHRDGESGGWRQRSVITNLTRGSWRRRLAAVGPVVSLSELQIVDSVSAPVGSLAAVELLNVVGGVDSLK